MKDCSFMAVLAEVKPLRNDSRGFGKVSLYIYRCTVLAMQYRPFKSVDAAGQVPSIAEKYPHPSTTTAFMGFCDILTGHRMFLITTNSTQRAEDLHRPTPSIRLSADAKAYFICGDGDSGDNARSLIVGPP